MSVEILQGDCRETLKTLPDASVNCCVTSPPYFGLRDYGHGGQIGLEESPDAFVQQMVGVFREVKRVLRDDGTLWLNLGDSYSPGARTTQVAPTLRHSAKDAASGKQAYLNNFAVRPKGDAWSKPKDLLGIPWRVAFALQADEWYLRQDIIWHKPNPMPESVTDRCTKAHEYIFLLSKSARYFYDAEAICEPSEGVSGGPFSQKTHEGRRSAMAGGAEIGRPEDKGTRNRRSVWSVVTKPYKAAHFATFPPDLIRPCILAGCPTGGTVLDPFGGSGTTGQVAMEEGRNAILCELNADYVGLIRKRIGGVTPSLFGRAA
jgi:DNA modification methylase